MKITDNLYAFLWNNPSANNCNTYLIEGEKTVLIDPGHYHLLSHIDERLSELSLSLQEIDLVVITHAHPDHMEGIKAFLDSETLISIGESEMDAIKKAAPRYGKALGISYNKIDILLQEGDLKIGNSMFQVINAPGHSPGSICLYWPDKKALFTGDVVFNQGIGRTDLPGGNGQLLKESIKKISMLDVEYLLPGHGDIISGHMDVKANFQDIERMWFGYI
ncbi:MBL fold metallo-hydrolase [Thermodesulfobacteriota bacterium]